MRRMKDDRELLKLAQKVEGLTKAKFPGRFVALCIPRICLWFLFSPYATTEMIMRSITILEVPSSQTPRGHLTTSHFTGPPNKYLWLARASAIFIWRTWEPSIRCRSCSSSRHMQYVNSEHLFTLDIYFLRIFWRFATQRRYSGIPRKALKILEQANIGRMKTSLRFYVKSPMTWMESNQN